MEPSEYFTCLICHEIPDPTSAIQCRGCRTVFCEACVEKWSSVAGDCANCRESHGYDVADKAIQRVLGETVVECPYECGKTTPKSELRDHCRLCERNDGRFDFTGANRERRTVSEGAGAGASGGAGPSRVTGAQGEQEQCESGIGQGAMLAAAALGGALIGIVGGVVGSLVVNSVKKRRDK